MNEQNYFYIIPASLAEDGKPQKALLYGLITSLARKDGTCTASNDFLVKKLGKKHRGTISQLLMQLEKDGWIEMKVDQKKGNKRTIKILVGITKKRKTSYEKPCDPSYEKPSHSNISNNNINSNIAPASGAEVIPDLLKDKQKHIRIIGLWAREKKITFVSKDHQKTYIRRNLRAARDLVPYQTDRIIEVMAYLIKNADFKTTLESVGKFIDEDLDKIKMKKQDGSGYGRLHDGMRVVKKFGKWFPVNNDKMEVDPKYYPEVAKDEVMSEEEWQEKNKK
jgi:hypothetical protein